jgi:hypothetical protein
MKKMDESDVKAELLGHLKELHLPAFRSGYEEMAVQAQQESLSYERYLLGLAGSSGCCGSRSCLWRRRGRRWS